ncbi:MAG TPA: sugar ABC transporter ATP-binding protein [Naasia sp.]|jgi:ABC-type sugar transport system ATPase subunit
MSTVDDFSTTTAAPPLISVTDLSKTFGGVHALKEVSLAIRPGVVHGLIGANGAGKSTLIKCLAGIEQPDSGTVEIDGQAVAISTPDAAGKLGLAFIHQEMSLIPGWNVLRNMMLGQRPPTRLGVIDWGPARKRARVVAERLGMAFPLSASVDDLSPADQWLILIGRALLQDARMIAMDEPTASLSASEATRVHRIIRELAASGTAVIFVSHRLDEVSELCEDITVFKDGAVTKRTVATRVSKPELVSAIVGRDLDIPEHGHAVTTDPGRAVLQLENLTDGRLVKDVSLTVHAGEVVGLAGLVGAGRTSTVKIVYGAGRRTGGRVLLEGRPVDFREPAEAVRAGIGLVPEERRSEGVFLDRSIDFNINIATLSSLKPGKVWPLLRFGEGRRRATEIAKAVTVKARDVGALVGSLSGGNQQKVAIARWLVDTPRLLILDEPSRGVDVGARAEVHSVIRGLAGRGTAVLAVSSDNEELVALCDRVLVLVEGRVAGELVGTDITVDHILSLSFDRHDKDAA